MAGHLKENKMVKIKHYKKQTCVWTGWYNNVHTVLWLNSPSQWTSCCWRRTLCKSHWPVKGATTITNWTRQYSQISTHIFLQYWTLILILPLISLKTTAHLFVPPLCELKHAVSEQQDSIGVVVQCTWLECTITCSPMVCIVQQRYGTHYIATLSVTVPE